MKAKLLILFFVSYCIFLSTVNAAVILPALIDKTILDNIKKACNLPDNTASSGIIGEAQYSNKLDKYYIDTECPTKSQDQSIKLVKSRFYYKTYKDERYVEENGELNNILGVLVPAKRSPQSVQLGDWKAQEQRFNIDSVLVDPNYRKTIAENFVLNSPARLTINSSMRTENDNFVAENNNRAFIKNIRFNNAGVVVGSANLISFFLKPENSKFTRFTSSVENYIVDNVTITGFTGLEKPEDISNTVYLRIDGRNSSYVFGLKISSYTKDFEAR
ncbi:MAG: hypothetical protein K0R49_1459, partial [Burkholderiales bacterium]|nr:hypothetical protein [Burkholderiales bacterium]